MADNDKEVLTKEGKANIEKKLQRLINVEKPRALADLNLARSQGDLSENADYDAARERVQELETEINRLQFTLDHCIILDEGAVKAGDLHTCRLGGGLITVKNIEKGTTEKFTIVGSAEADPLNGKISNTCPVAIAVLGHRAGDTVEVQVKVPYSLVIESIEEN